MTIQKIYCSALDDVHTVIEQQGVSHIITLINDAMMLETPNIIAQDHHLKLAMNDIAVPTDNLIIPAQDHIERLERFVLAWDQKSPMLIHCWAGVSRSTAAVFISLCILNPNQDEMHIGQYLRQASPIAYPNRKLVQLADDYLERDGRMIKAVEQMGRGEMASQGRVFNVSIAL